MGSIPTRSRQTRPCRGIPHGGSAISYPFDPHSGPLPGGTRPRRIDAAYWILALATTTRIGGEVARVWVDAAALRWAVALAGVVQVIGFALYFRTMWPRIRAVGSHLREAKGERFWSPPLARGRTPS